MNGSAQNRTMALHDLEWGNGFALIDDFYTGTRRRSCCYYDSGVFRLVGGIAIRGDFYGDFGAAGTQSRTGSDNPIASVLIAAGMAWLIFSESKSSGLTKPRRTIRRGRKKGHTARNSKAAAAVRSN
jgi:hypothetical protein